MTSRVSGLRAVQPREGLEQQVESLLRLEPADRADHDVVGRRARATAHRRFATRASRANCRWSMPLRIVVTAAGSAPCSTSSRPMSLDTAIRRGKRASTRLSAG